MSRFSKRISEGRYTKDRRVPATDVPEEPVAPITISHHQRMHGTFTTGASREEARDAFVGHGTVKPEAPITGRTGRMAFAVGRTPQEARANLKAARASGTISDYQRRPPPRPGPVARVAPPTARDLAEDGED